MRFGVTGAGGYIGRLLSVRLVEAGHEVVLVDSRYPHPQIPTVLLSYDVEESLDRLSECAVILHLAATSGVIACDADPVQALWNNVGGLVRLTNHLRKLSRRIPVVFASTFSVFGGRTEEIRRDSPLAPLNEYARQKVAGEMVVRSLGACGHILRMSNVYGGYRIDGQTYRKGNVISLFAERVRAGQPMRIHSPGTQVRDFLHVEDAVAYWIAAAERSAREPDGSVFHVASGETMSMLELARAAQRYHPGARYEMVDNPRVEGTADSFRVEIESTRQLLKVSPRHRLEDAIRSEFEDD